MGMPCCQMCGQASELQLGHVIPRFAIKWIKKTSGNPLHKRLRHAHDGSIAQDGEKFRMFCRKCAQVLNRDETEFSKRAFGDSYFMSAGPVPYEEWMLRFAVGLMLRVCVANLHFRQPEHVREPLAANERRSVERAMEEFRRYLTCETLWPGKLAPMRISVGLTAIPTGPLIRNVWDHYMTRSVDGALVLGDGIVAVYAHIPFHVFWTQIKPGKVRQRDSLNCRIRKRGTIDFNLTQRPSEHFWEFLQSRLTEVRPTFEEALERTARQTAGESGADLRSTPKGP